MAPLLYFVRRARSQFQAIVELAVAGFDYGLVQVALGKITGEIVSRKGRRQSTRLRHRRLAALPGWLGRSGLAATRPGRAARDAGEKANS